MTQQLLPGTITETFGGLFAYTKANGDVSEFSYVKFDDAAKAYNQYYWYDVENLGTRLQNEELTVRFTKVDGTVRELKCTAQSSAFPTRTTEPTRQKAPKPDVQVVWDYGTNSVRSFRKDSVISVS